MAKSQPSFKMLITEVTVRLNARSEPSQRPMKVTPEMESGLTCQVLLRNNKDFAFREVENKVQFPALITVFTITLRDSSLMAKGTIMKFYICKLVYHRKLLLWNLEFSNCDWIICCAHNSVFYSKCSWLRMRAWIWIAQNCAANKERWVHQDCGVDWKFCCNYKRY